ncbi:YtcA family lipoprotein [Morganella morganii]|uniref:YtcA family lipoprotein n=1 Tax=Morganella morganii TaxID=582 RepID=UPI0032085C8F
MIRRKIFFIRHRYRLPDGYNKCVRAILLMVLLVSGPAGCNRVGAPSFTLVGSFVPYWILCIIVALILTVIIRAGFIRWGLDDVMPLRLVVYICLMLTLTFLFSLLFL